MGPGPAPYHPQQVSQVSPKTFNRFFSSVPGNNWIHQKIANPNESLITNPPTPNKIKFYINFVLSYPTEVIKKNKNPLNSTRE
jgi:hypothetical protein